MTSLKAELQMFQLAVGAWSRMNFPGNLPHHPLLGIGEESGELMHAHLKCEQGIRGTAAQHVAAKKDAVGDIIIYLADYCERNDIDLGFAVSDTWFKVRQRNWRANPEDGGES